MPEENCEHLGSKRKPCLECPERPDMYVCKLMRFAAVITRDERKFFHANAAVISCEDCLRDTRKKAKSENTDVQVVLQQVTELLEEANDKD